MLLTETPQSREGKIASWRFLGFKLYHANRWKSTLEQFRFVSSYCFALVSCGYKFLSLNLYRTDYAYSFVPFRTSLERTL